MKYIHNINKWSLIITLVLYLGVYLGAMSQIALGFIQVILALSLLTQWKKLSKSSKRLLLIYWFVVIIYGVVYLIFEGKSSLNIFYWIFIPLIIATYFVYVTFKVKEEFKI